MQPTDSYSNDEAHYSLINDHPNIASDPNNINNNNHDSSPLEQLRHKYFGSDGDAGGVSNLNRALRSIGMSGIDNPIDPADANTLLNGAFQEAVDVMQISPDTPETRLTMKSIFQKLNAISLVVSSLVKLKDVDAVAPSRDEGDVEDSELMKFLPAKTKMKHVNNFQKALMWVLTDLSMKGYRKYKENLVQRRYVHINNQELPTCSWRIVSSIDEYCASLTLNRMHAPELWMWVTSVPTGVSLIANINNHLKNSREIELPDIDVSKTIFSFSNGVYNCREELFISYTDSSAIAGKLNKWFACNHFDKPFNATWCSVPDPIQIPTHTMDSIMDCQKWSPDVRRWFFVMLGRLLYNTRDYDDWQVCLFLKGNAGTGKSVLLDFIGQLYEADCIGYLQDNVQKVFGLSEALIGKYTVLCDDVGRGWSLKSCDFQNIVSGNMMSLAVKHKDSVRVRWTAPLMVSGNELPNFSDNMGSVSRRIVSFLFSQIVQNPDSRIEQKLKDEIPQFVCKANRVYRNMVRRYPNLGSVWKVLPPELQQIRDETANYRNALQGAVHSDDITFAKPEDAPESVYMPIDQLHLLVKKYAQTFCMAEPMWVPDYYKIPLQNMGLKLERRELPYPRSSTRKLKTQYIIGIDLTTNYEAAKNKDQNSHRMGGSLSALHAEQVQQQDQQQDQQQQQQQPPPQKRARITETIV